MKIFQRFTNAKKPSGKELNEIFESTKDAMYLDSCFDQFIGALDVLGATGHGKNVCEQYLRKLESLGCSEDVLRDARNIVEEFSNKDMVKRE